MCATTLYRQFDKSGHLLYIGVSNDIERRLSQHRLSSKWFNNVYDVKMEQYETRKEALAAEKQAIFKEKPKYNKVWNKGSLVPSSEYSAARMRLDVYKRFKIHCAVNEKSIVELLTEIVSDFLRKQEFSKRR